MIYDLESRQFVYNRTGILATTTVVNEEVATEFMRVSDLRRDIVVVDSGKKPEANTVAVKSDTLAFRIVAPLSELTKIVLKPKQFHEIEIVDDQYKVSIHDLLIDDDIRKKNYQNREDYERQYLGKLKREVKEAATEILFAEKLGFQDQKINYILYGLTTAVLSATDVALSSLLQVDYPTKLLILHHIVFSCVIVNPALNLIDQIVFKMNGFDEIPSFPNFKPFLSPGINPRPWQKSFYPLIPIDKWAKGKKFLWQHGEELISTKA